MDLYSVNKPTRRDQTQLFHKNHNGLHKSRAEIRSKLHHRVKTPSDEVLFRLDDCNKPDRFLIDHKRIVISISS